jgi:hypothetical protein
LVGRQHGEGEGLLYLIETELLLFDCAVHAQVAFLLFAASAAPDVLLSSSGIHLSCNQRRRKG